MSMPGGQVVAEICQEYSASSELMMEAVNSFPEAFKSVIDKHNKKYTMVLKDSSFWNKHSSLPELFVKLLRRLGLWFKIYIVQ